MIFLIYDKHGLFVYALDIFCDIKSQKLQEILDKFNRDVNKDFDINLFRRYLVTYNIDSNLLKTDRINIREVEDARLD